MVPLPFLIISKVREVLRKNFAKLSLFVVSVIAYGTFSEYLLERNVPGTGVRNLFDSLWFVMQTITTVGYGDTPVVSFWGRVNAVALMVVGIGILGFFSASFASLLIDYSSSRRLGERRLRMKNHVVICNWNAIAQELVREILEEKTNAVLLAPLEKTPFDPIEFVKGTCLHVEDLRKASVAEAESVIILSETITDEDLLCFQRSDIPTSAEVGNYSLNLFLTARIYGGHLLRWRSSQSDLPSPEFGFRQCKLQCVCGLLGISLIDDASTFFS